MPLRTSAWWWFLKNDRGVLVAQPGAVGDERVAQRVVALGEAPPEPLAKLVESGARPLAPHRPRGRRARGQRGSPPGPIRSVSKQTRSPGSMRRSVASWNHGLVLGRRRVGRGSHPPL